MVCVALACVERKPRLNVRPPESICHDLVATAYQEITECIVLAPQIQRRITIRNGTVAPAFAQQKSFEVKLRNGVPERAPFLRPGADQSGILIGRQAMGVVRDDHG
jgi:hypothetical protein